VLAAAGPAAATAATDEDDEGTSRLSPTAEADCGITFSGDLPLFRERENIFLYMYLSIELRGKLSHALPPIIFLLGGSTLALNPPQTPNEFTNPHPHTHSHTNFCCRLLRV
jgi:hypothetical protein